MNVDIFAKIGKKEDIWACMIVSHFQFSENLERFGQEMRENEERRRIIRTQEEREKMVKIRPSPKS